MSFYNIDYINEFLKFITIKYINISIKDQHKFIFRGKHNVVFLNYKPNDVPLLTKYIVWRYKDTTETGNEFVGEFYARCDEDLIDLIYDDIEYNERSLDFSNEELILFKDCY